MPRAPRLLLQDRPSVYHVMSRTALDGFPFGDGEKEILLSVIRRFSKIYFCDIIGFALMGNHFHLLVRMHPEDSIAEHDIQMRFQQVYGDDAYTSHNRLMELRRKWTSLSEFMREIKQTFSRIYNKRHARRGTLWGERYKSVLVEDGHALINCLAYIDLNPVRAGIVRKPENYRWSSIGYHLQTGNHDHLLSLDFGLADSDIEPEERQRLYRQFLYETGAIPSNKGKTLNTDLIDQTRQTNFSYSRAERFRLRTRWFTDSGIIGSKSFIHSVAQHLGLAGATKRSPQNISGLDMYSLKRLTESTG
ncbi:transposase [Desulfovibrio inopinatus]|uniref:transposase n=1 Tax=Desulfovibrio inopinatus TaxID=102109 RepID=UPI0003F9E2B3|nr:transposase [Desulfovibrio inopinatus]